MISERKLILILLTICLVLWLTGQISTLGAVVLSLTISFALGRLSYHRRINDLKHRRREHIQPGDKTHKGLQSVRTAALNSLPTPVLILNQEYQIVLANNAAKDLLHADVLGQDAFLYLRQPQTIEQVKTALSTGIIRPMIADGETLYLRFNTADERSFDLSLAIIQNDGEPNAKRQLMVFFYELTSMLRSEQMRVDFVANASHELRTPLSSLIGSIETLQGPAADDPEAQIKFLSIMQRESERMIRLIDDLLSLSKIEMSRHKFPSDAVNINQAIYHSVNTAQVTASPRQITFKLDLDHSHEIVKADEDQITQVLLNLIVNAAKYADEETVVHISTRTDLDKADLILTIRDEGPGISAEHLGRLTERFYRVDTARSRKMGGTGLGLAIVKHILLRHKSQLEIKSQLKQGTIFSFRLPLISAENASQKEQHQKEQEREPIPEANSVFS